MPITQDRMVNLCRAARDVYQAYEALASAISEAFAEDMTNPQIAGLRTFAGGIAPRPNSIVLIALEEAHFKRMGAHNINQQSRMARKRKVQGKPERRPPIDEPIRHEKQQVLEELTGTKLPSYNGMTKVQFEQLMHDSVVAEALRKKQIGAVQPDGTVIQPDGLESGSPDPGLPDVDKLIG